MADTEHDVTYQSQAEDASTKKPISRMRKRLAIAILAVVAVLVLLAIFGATTKVVPTYSTSDLVTVTNSNATFLRPQQWEDASYAENLKKDFGLDVSNTSIYGDEVVKNKNGEYDVANAFVVFGQSPGEPVDVVATKTPAFREAFEKSIDKSLQQDSFKSETCRSILDYVKNYNYDLNGFPVSVAIKFNCQLSETEKKKYDAESIEIRMAVMIANDGKSYLYALIATDESWAKNEPVYLKMLESLKAQ